MRVLTVVGARPQFVKAAVVSPALREAGIAETIVHTGQHYSENMSQVFFEELGIPEAHVNLGIRAEGHGAQTGRMLIALEEVMRRERPDRVLVYGDTNSTLAGALAAAKLNVPVDHVEAGLRSFNRAMPEEVNRVLTDHLADLLFAPSATAVGHLTQEGIAPGRIRRVGDVMYDSVLQHGRRARERSRIGQTLGLTAGSYAVATIHRAENTDDPVRLAALAAALDGLAGEAPVVLPAHPRLVKSLGRAGLSFGVVRVLEPLGYLDMLALVMDAKLALTDSGGLQKEAAFLGVPCITLRDETEWTELVDLGWNRLAPPRPGLDLRALAREGVAHPRRSLADTFGTGEAGRAIADALTSIERGKAG